MTRPLIAVTGPDKKLKFGWWATRFILWLCGARSCYVTPSKPHLINAVDGVVIGGGDDIEPQHYGEVAPVGKDGDFSRSYDPARDQLEIAMIKAALKSDVPMLGICRGAQLINVVSGGNLHQDIRPLRSITPNRNSAFIVKLALIEEHSILKGLLNKAVVKINSLHSQAVKRIGKGLTIAAYDKDGFVQAFEHRQKLFLIGVQWHPEYLPYHAIQRKLFKKMVSAVKQQKNKITPDVFNEIHSQ